MFGLDYIEVMVFFWKTKFDLEKTLLFWEKMKTERYSSLPPKTTQYEV